MPVDTSLSSLLRAVPLARRSPAYFGTVFIDGQSTFAEPSADQWERLGVRTVLELGSGKSARWSSALGLSAAAPDRLVAADLNPPACTCAECIAADNSDLRELAAARPQAFDLIYGSHVLCTCRWVAAPWRYASGPMSTGRPLGVTCGGIELEAAAVERFVASLKALLRPGGGVAVFDQEGGWPFGLESELRRAARSQGLWFYTRRGPLWTNFDYVLSTSPLVDDVSPDGWQRDARCVDAALVLFAPAVLALVEAVRDGDLPRDLVPLLSQLKAAVAVGIGARLVLPYADVVTTRDVRWLARGVASRLGSIGRK